MWFNFSFPLCGQYLGSTHVKELKGTESTMKSIQKLKKTSSDGTKVPKIILSVSYKGVKFMDCNTQVSQCFCILFFMLYITEINCLMLYSQVNICVFQSMKCLTKFPWQTLVCEHEIRNIHCACQDAEDLSHFAYITKDLETKGHYCHVFRVQTRVSVAGQCDVQRLLSSSHLFCSIL